MPRFVILRHETPDSARGEVHWDFMLEQNGALHTWALEWEPDESDREIAAQALDDHRLSYLDFEGSISGDRGSVTRWDAGEYEFLSESREELSVRLRGKKLAGLVQLRRNPSEPHLWTFIYCA